MESFFNISVSYREDAEVKNSYGGLVQERDTAGKNLTDIINKFGANNRQLAKKTAKESQTTNEILFQNIFFRLAEPGWPNLCQTVTPRVTEKVSSRPSRHTSRLMSTGPAGR